MESNFVFSNSLLKFFLILTYFSFLKCLGHPKTAAVHVQDGQQRDKEKGEDAVN